METNLRRCKLAFSWTTYIKTEFLKTQAIKPWLWKRFIDVMFFIWTDSEENLNKFLKHLYEFYPNLKCTYEKSKKKINCLDLVIKLADGKIVTDLLQVY